MGFAGENDLDRPPAAIQQHFKTVEVTEDKVSPFIGGEPAGKTDGQRQRVEQRSPGDDIGRADVIFCPSQAGAISDEINEFDLVPVMGLP